MEESNIGIQNNIDNFQYNLNPLVSIVVITYNSSEFVLETLESARSQTYQNIELIVSDDASTDNTLEICENWVKKNRHRFLRTEIIGVENNTGIAGNCNRGVNASRGIWIKLIAGDDVLKPNCIASNISYIRKNQGEEVNIIHSSMEYYSNYLTTDNFIKLRSLANHVITDRNITANWQYRLLLRGCYINTPSVFAKRQIFTDLTGFDESLAVEDWPMWLKLTSYGIKFHYFNEPTIKYRVRDDSHSNERIEGIIHSNHFMKQREIYEKYIYENIPLLEKIFLQLNFLRINFLSKFFAKNNTINRYISKITTVPYWFYYNYCIKLIHIGIKGKIKNDKSY